MKYRELAELLMKYPDDELDIIHYPFNGNDNLEFWAKDGEDLIVTISAHE